MLTIHLPPTCRGKASGSIGCCGNPGSSPGAARRREDELSTDPTAEHTIADKGYDSEEVRDTIRKKSSTPVIPRKSNSRMGNVSIMRCMNGMLKQLVVKNVLKIGQDSGK